MYIHDAVGRKDKIIQFAIICSELKYILSEVNHKKTKSKNDLLLILQYKE